MDENQLSQQLRDVMENQLANLESQREMARLDLISIEKRIAQLDEDIAALREDIEKLEE